MKIQTSMGRKYALVCWVGLLVALLLTTLVAYAAQIAPQPQQPVSAPAATIEATAAGAITSAFGPTATATETGSVPIPQIGATNEITLPAVEPLDVKGDIVIAGGSTLFPLAEDIYQRFILDGFADEIRINSVGTGAGFQLFCQQKGADVAIASRRITRDELDTCMANGLTPVEFQVATDALSIVVSNQNTFVQGVTRAELAKISHAARWSDVNPAWPSEPIERYVPPPSTGTFDFYVEQVLDGNASVLLNASDLTQLIDYDSLAQDVANSPYAIGFMGYVYYNPYAQRHELRALAIDAVAPTAQSVATHNYPLSRPLFFYISLETLLGKEQVRAFANYFLTHVQDDIEHTGYFATSQDALNRSKARLLEVIQGNIVTAGSDILSPLTQAMAARLSALGYTGGVSIRTVNSGDDFRTFCQNWAADIVNDTRRMDIAEIVSCTVSDRTPVRLRIGTEALAVVVNRDNDFIKDVTPQALAALFSVERWSDVNPPGQTNQSNALFPMSPLARLISLQKRSTKAISIRILRAANTLQSSDNEILAGGVADTVNGISFLPYTVYLQHTDKLTALTIDQVAPNQATVEEGVYLLARPLFVFSATSLIQQKPQVAAFLNLLLTHVDEDSQRLDFYPASEQVLADSRKKLLDAMSVQQ